MPNPTRILRRKDVEHLTGLSRSSIYALASSGDFPKQHKLSSRSVGWLESDVLSWIAERTGRTSTPADAGSE